VSDSDQRFSLYLYSSKLTLRYFLFSFWTFNNPGDEKKVPKDKIAKWKKEFGLDEGEEKKKGYKGSPSYREKEIQTLEDRKSRKEVSEQQKKKEKRKPQSPGYSMDIPY